jgi:alanyl-tRNA synthetase
MQSLAISQTFLEHYQGRGFSVLPSASLLHPSIPMSFVMSAGLPQFETALDQAGKHAGHKYVLVQKCFRYFDIDTVGTDDVHLSLFEMPAAFSFNTLSKATVIRQMWELVTSNLGIKPDNLWITYFAGGRISKHTFDEDVEVYQAWRKTGVPKERIIGLGVKDNFWKQGNGIEGMVRYRKCGPNTEVFFDRGTAFGCGPDCRPPCQCGRFVELANSLFVSTEIDTETQRLQPMTEPFFETVIGTERMAMALQSAQSVFGIDSYRPIIDAVHSFVRTPDLPGSLIAASEHVTADYLKALYFLVADGAPPPGKNGRERIIKLLIRGVITRQIILGVETKKFLPTLIDCISQTVHDTQRATLEDEKRLMSYFSTESQRFSKTIARGSRQLERFLKENTGCTLSGPQIVCLEKKWGLPHLLTAAMLREKELAFAEAEYRESLEVWRHQPHN